jgi:hypothetical protein
MKQWNMRVYYFRNYSETFSKYSVHKSDVGKANCVFFWRPHLEKIGVDLGKARHGSFTCLDVGSDF